MHTGAKTLRPWARSSGRISFNRSILHLRASRRLCTVTYSSSKAPFGPYGKNRLGVDSSDRPNLKSDLTEGRPYLDPEKLPDTLERNAFSKLGRNVGVLWDDFKGRLLYSYYNWRQDTWSDLQLFLLFNFFLFVGGAWMEGHVIRQMDHAAPSVSSDAAPEWWGDLYSVLTWVLGQDLPEPESGLASQVFAVFTVILGLASFALVLALIEQVVLEVLESNVKRGSTVYERNHFVVLAWCESSYDMAQLARLLRQLCYGNLGAEKSVVVVLTLNREKLEMESVLRDAIPVEERYGTQFVFRQGSPLDPGALHMVGVTKARAVIICGDGARRSLDSDAQCMRAAVLVDEMVESTPGAGPNIIVQIKSADPLPVLKYSCSRRVIAVPTSIAQARRISRMLKQPIAALLSQMLTDYYSQAHIAIHHFPQLEGVPFGRLHFYFPSAILVGIVNAATGQSYLNPRPDRKLEEGEEILMMRCGPAGLCDSAMPLRTPLEVDVGDWEPTAYIQETQGQEPLGVARASTDAAGNGDELRPLWDYASPGEVSNRAESEDEGEALASWNVELDSEKHSVKAAWRRLGANSQAANGGQASAGYYLLPTQFSSSIMPASDLLVCGWGGVTFMWTLLQDLDHGPQCLPKGSRVTLVNDHEDLPVLDVDQLAAQNIRNLRVTHIKTDPRSRSKLQQCVDVSKFKAAIVLCDCLWSDAESNAGNQRRQHSLSQAEMLRLDAATLLVQMNVRYMLEEQGLPMIHFVVEKMTYIGSTRYEDPFRLPMGIPVNQPKFCAKMLGMAAFDARFMKPLSEMGLQSDLVVQDSSVFTAPGEEVSYLQLQARASLVRQCVLGYYVIPTSADQPLDLVVNPQGVEARSKRVVLNQGDSRCKVITLALNKAVRGTAKERLKAILSSSSPSSPAFPSNDATGSFDGADAGTVPNPNPSPAVNSNGARGGEACDGEHPTAPAVRAARVH